MAINDVIFVKGQGGLGRSLPSLDHVSGMIFFSDTLPAGFGASDRIQIIKSVDDAENLGILDTHADETKATGGQAEITTPGAADDVNSISINGGLLGSYTVVSGDANADVATGLAAAINAKTVDHGYTATATLADVDIVAPAKKGVSINTTGLTFATTGTGAATVTQFSGGVGSFNAVMHYQISEYFRIQPNGKLYVGIYAETEGTTYTGSRIQTVQDFAEGEIRQMTVFNQKATFATGQVTASQTYADTNYTNHKPANVILHSDMTGLSLATLSDLTTLDSEYVSVVIGEDGNWHQAAYSNTTKYLIGSKVSFNGSSYKCKKATTGNSPFEGEYWTLTSINLPDVTGYTVSSLGLCLGTVSLAAVHENIGWVSKFPLASGDNLDISGFATGDLYKDQSVSTLSTLNDKSYIYLRKHQGVTNTYWDDSFTATLKTSDYATIENNRTIDKAVRNVRTQLLPKLSGPLYVDSDGKLAEATIANYKSNAEKPLEALEIDGEISAFSVTIDPDQNVLSTSKVVVSIQIIPVGVARDIQVNIGFVVSI